MAIEKLNKTFVDGELLSADDLNPLSQKTDELVDQTNTNTDEIVTARDGQDSLYDKIKFVENKVDANTNEIVTARNGKTDLDTRISDIENEVVTARGGDTDLNTRISDIENEVVTARDGQDNLYDKIKFVENKTDTNTNEIVIARDGQNSLYDKIKEIEAKADTNFCYTDNTPLIQKPYIITPVNGQTDFYGTVQSSEFATTKFYYGKHDDTDWEVATDEDFINVVVSSYDDTTNLTSWTLPHELDKLTTYYVRVRYKSDNHISDWSDAVKFVTPANQPPVIDGVQWSSDTLYDNKTYTVTINAHDPDNDLLTYSVTCSDSNVTITQDTNNPNQFSVTFPVYSQDTTVTFTYTVSDGQTDVSQEEEKLIKYIPLLEAKYFDSYKPPLGIYASKDFSTFYVTCDSVVQFDRDLNVLKSLKLNMYYTECVYDDGSNIYVMGTTNSAFEMGIAKFDSSFNVIKAVGSDYKNSRLMTTVRDNAGYIYTVGYAQDSNGNDLLYLAKFNDSLSVLKQVTTYVDCNPVNRFWIYKDSSGSIYANSVGDVSYIAKFDSNLNVLNQVSFAQTPTNSISKIFVDDQNNIFCGGHISPTGQTNSNAFLVKFDSDLNVILQKSLSSDTSSLIVADMFVDSEYVYICGNSQTYPYIAVLSKDFNLIKYFELNVSPSGVVVDTEGRVYLVASEKSSPSHLFLIKINRILDMSGSYTCNVGSQSITFQEKNATISDISVGITSVSDSYTNQTNSFQIFNVTEQSTSSSEEICVIQ